MTIRFAGIEITRHPKGRRPIRYRWFTEMRRESENAKKYHYERQT